MTRRFAWILLWNTWLAAPGAAQSAASRDSIETRQRELWVLQQQQDRVRPEIAERQRAEELQQQFVEKVNRFVQLWDGLVTDFNQKRAFNLKRAKALSKAFHELERSGGWPKADTGL